MEASVPSSPFRFQGHVPALDGVRATAALCVFVYHYGGGSRQGGLPLRLIGEAIHLGWVGVSLFFVLSGLLITGILWDSMVKDNWWRRFIVRRSLRIFPLYYLALLIAYFAEAFQVGGRFQQAGFSIYAVYAQNIPSLLGYLPRLTATHLGHFWTLAVEEQFYLVWPFALFLVRRSNVAATTLCAGVWLVSLGSRLLVSSLALPGDWSIDFLTGRMGELSIGAFLAIFLRTASAKSQTRLARALWSILLISAAVVGVCIMFDHSTRGYGTFMSTLGISALSIFFGSFIAKSLLPGRLAFLLSSKTLGRVGKISYGIYVYHLLLRPLFEGITRTLFPNLGATQHSLVLAIIAFAGTLLVSSLSFRLFESRFLAMRDSRQAFPVPARKDLPELAERV